MNTEIESPKYNDIVNTAHELFWKYGIRRVSIEEICRESNVSKMTFYKFFSNKTDLGKTVIDQIFEANIKKYRKIMDSDISFKEKIKQFVLMKIEGTNDISNEFIQDVVKNKKLGLAEYFQEKANEVSIEVLKTFSEAQKKGWIRKDMNINFLLAFNSKLVNLIDDPTLLKITGSTSKLVEELVNLFFYGIFPQNETSI